VASQPRLLALAPLFFAMGAFQAVGFSTLTGAVVAPQLGAGWVGFVGAAYSASASAFVLALPAATLRPRVGRRWAVALAAGNWAAVLACLLAWVAAYDPRRGPAAPPRAAAFAALFAASCSLGAGDGAMQALMSATLQTWWPAHVPAALAFMRSLMALGTATVAGVGARAEPAAQFAALLALFLAALVPLYAVHTRGVSIDGGERGGGKGAGGGEGGAVGEGGGTGGDAEAPAKGKEAGNTAEPVAAQAGMPQHGSSRRGSALKLAEVPVG
jgi:MFS family permease